MGIKGRLWGNTLHVTLPVCGVLVPALALDEEVICWMVVLNDITGSAVGVNTSCLLCE